MVSGYDAIKLIKSSNIDKVTVKIKVAQFFLTQCSLFKETVERAPHKKNKNTA